MNIYIGAAKLEISMPGNRSLKDKRQVIKSVIDRVGRSRTMAISEVGNHDLWKSATLALVCLCEAPSRFEEGVSEVIDMLEMGGEAEVSKESRWVFKPEEE